MLVCSICRAPYNVATGFPTCVHGDYNDSEHPLLQKTGDSIQRLMRERDALATDKLKLAETIISMSKEIESLRAKLREAEDAAKDADAQNILSAWWMHDNHTFTQLEGRTVEELKAHADSIGMLRRCGSLCPVTLLRDKREIRRVGPHIMDNRWAKQTEAEWQRELDRWGAALEADQDVMRILDAAIAAAKEGK